MSDAGTLPQGSEGTAAPAPQPEITDQRSAADFLERSGLLDALGGDGDDDSGQKPDAGDGESHPTGEEEGHSEPQEAPAAIEPPKSWSDEEKAVFGELPPEAQRVIASREGERDKAFNRKTEEVAEQRKAVDAHAAAIQQERAQYVQNLQKLAAIAIPPEAQQILQITPQQWAQLGAEQPAEYAKLDGARKAIEGRLAFIQQEMTRAQQQAAFEQQQALAEILPKEFQKVAERIPEFADEAKRGKLISDVRNDLVQRGFSEQEIGTVADARLVEVAHDAMRWRQHEAALKAAKAKTAAPPAPRVQRPGTASDTTGDGASRQVRDDFGRFGKSGDVRDAGRVLMHILG